MSLIQISQFRAQEPDLILLLKANEKDLPKTIESKPEGKGIRRVVLNIHQTDSLYDLGEVVQLPDVVPDADNAKSAKALREAGVDVLDPDVTFYGWFRAFVPATQGGTLVPAPAPEEAPPAAGELKGDNGAGHTAAPPATEPEPVEPVAEEPKKKGSSKKAAKAAAEPEPPKPTEAEQRAVADLERLRTVIDSDTTTEDAHGAFAKAIKSGRDKAFPRFDRALSLGTEQGLWHPGKGGKIVLGPEGGTKAPAKKAAKGKAADKPATKAAAADKPKGKAKPAEPTTLPRESWPQEWVPGRILRAEIRHPGERGTCEYAVECVELDGKAGYRVTHFVGNRNDIKVGDEYRTSRALFQAITGRPRPNTVINRVFDLKKSDPV